MPEYKKNHYIPKVLLKNWVVSGATYEGVHVFEIEPKKFSFSASRGGSGFSFAIINDLYVPILEGERIVDAEKWLSGLEGSIGKILPMLLASTDIRYESHLEAVKFVMGLLSLQYRSEYILSRVRETVATDPDAQQFLGLHSGRTVDQIVVENIVNSVDEFLREMAPVKMRIFQPTSGEFIVSDRPVLDEDYVGERIVVVAPKVAIALSKGTQPFEYQYVPINEDFTHQINDLVATQARSWIAGSSEMLVQKYSAVVESEKWLKMKNSEKVHMRPFKQLSQGWEFQKKK
ncbi:MAG: DUF4238 domain-containing protein [Bdellovibrionales bacterium]